MVKHMLGTSDDHFNIQHPQIKQIQMKTTIFSLSVHLFCFVFATNCKRTDFQSIHTFLNDSELGIILHCFLLCHKANILPASPLTSIFYLGVLKNISIIQNLLEPTSKHRAVQKICFGFHPLNSCQPAQDSRGLALTTL